MHTCAAFPTIKADIRSVGSGRRVDGCFLAFHMSSHHFMSACMACVFRVLIDSSLIGRKCRVKMEDKEASAERQTWKWRDTHTHT